MNVAVINGATAMASKWRRRPLCILIADEAAPAALGKIDAASALLETEVRPPLHSRVGLRHPEAGDIEGRVSAHVPDGVIVAFVPSERSMAFALAAITSDMSQPAL